ncbi:MAG: DedA family protein [Terracidiphilus sp.]
MEHHVYLVLSHFFRHYGYWTVLGATFLENLGVPLPGETTLFFASFLARRGDLQLTWAILAGIAGAALGEFVGFLIGRVGGRAFVERHRRKLLMSSKRYKQAQSVFLSNAGWAILLARFVGGLREVVGLLAGVFAMPLRRFLFFNIVSAVIWAVATGLAGFFLASSWRRLFRFLTRLNMFGFIVFAVVVIVLTIVRLRRGKAAIRQGPMESPEQQRADNAPRNC